MADRVFVNKEATVIKGVAKGITGLVVMANSKTKRVELELADGSCVYTSFDNISQESGVHA
jgi:ribosomal protein L24